MIRAYPEYPAVRHAELRHIEERNEYINRYQTDCTRKQCRETDIGHFGKKQYASDCCQKHIEYVADILDNRPKYIGVRMRLEAVIEKLLIELIKFLTAEIFMVEYLDDLLTVHHFLNKSLDLAERFLLTDEVLCRTAARASAHKQDSEYAEHYH